MSLRLRPRPLRPGGERDAPLVLVCTTSSSRKLNVMEPVRQAWVNTASKVPVICVGTSAHPRQFCIWALMPSGSLTGRTGAVGNCSSPPIDTVPVILAAGVPSPEPTTASTEGPVWQTWNYQSDEPWVSGTCAFEGPRVLTGCDDLIAGPGAAEVRKCPNPQRATGVRVNKDGCLTRRHRLGVSERRACRVLGQARSTHRHRARRPDDEPHGWWPGSSRWRRSLGGRAIGGLRSCCVGRAGR